MIRVSLWEWQGGGGIRCCLVCANIVSKPHLAAAHPDLFDCSCATVDKFQLHDFETLHQVIRTLFANEAAWLRGHMTKTLLLESQTSLGFVPTLEGVWANRKCARALDPCEHLQFDWVHNNLQEGVFSHELVSYMANVEAASRGSLESFLDLGWVFPHEHKSYRLMFCSMFCRKAPCVATPGHQRQTC